MDLQSINGARVLVTGCSGFVGRYLVRRLLGLGAYVHGLDRWKADMNQFRAEVDETARTRFEVSSGNLRDIASLATVVDKVNPDYVFHLAAQSYVPESFINPIDTIETNFLGTGNLLEVLRQKDSDARIVFAGSSEEYGLVVFSENQLERMNEKYGYIFPEPVSIPELPINETNPLRPMSPYAVSKVASDYLMRNYFHTYGLKTVVSRAFNHEGAGRGASFVTSIIAKQTMQLKYNERKNIVIGNVSAFRDWSHVKDIVNGYILLGLKGRPGDVYNQGSQRTNSVLTFIMLALKLSGMDPLALSTMKGDVKVQDPAMIKESIHFGLKFPTTTIDRMLLSEELEISLDHKGLIIETPDHNVDVVFNPDRFRPSEVPILLTSCKKIENLGFETSYSLENIVRDQLNFYLDPSKRS